MTEREEIERQPGACQICGHEMDVINIIPLHQPDGSLITMTCTKCTKESGMYCEKHGQIHQGFEDGSSACLFCIEEQVKDKGEEIYASFRSRVYDSAKVEEIVEAMGEYVELTAPLTGSTKEHCVARAIITVAQRKHQPTDEVIAETLEKGPEILFP